MQVKMRDRFEQACRMFNDGNSAAAIIELKELDSAGYLPATAQLAVVERVLNHDYLKSAYYKKKRDDAVGRGHINMALIKESDEGSFSKIKGISRHIFNISNFSKEKYTDEQQRLNQLKYRSRILTEKRDRENTFVTYLYMRKDSSEKKWGCLACCRFDNAEELIVFSDFYFRSKGLQIESYDEPIKLADAIRFDWIDSVNANFAIDALNEELDIWHSEIIELEA